MHSKTPIIYKDSTYGLNFLDQRVDLPKQLFSANVESLDFVGDFSIEIKTYIKPSYRDIMYFLTASFLGESSANSFRFRTNGSTGQVLFQYLDNTGTFRSLAGTATVDALNHFVFTFSQGVSANFYTNNSKVSNVVNTTLNSPWRASYIRLGSSSDRNPSCIFKYFRIYNELLTDAEVNYLFYNEQLDTSLAAKTVRNYSFGQKNGDYVEDLSVNRKKGLVYLENRLDGIIGGNAWQPI